MQAGLRIGSSQFAFGFAQRVESPLEYETRIVDRKAAVPPPPPTARLPSERERCSSCMRCTARPAAARCARERRARSQPFAQVEPARFAAVGDDLAPAAGREARRRPSPKRSRSAAASAPAHGRARVRARENRRSQHERRQRRLSAVGATRAGSTHRDARSAEDTAAGAGAARRHAGREQHDARVGRRAPVRPGRRDRHRSAAGRAHRAARRHRRTTNRTISPRSSSTIPICRGCSRRRPPMRRAALRPWLVLVVVRKQDGVRAAAAAQRAAAGARDRRRPRCRPQELPDLADSWAWAHAQLGAHERRDRRRRCAHVLATRPELSVSRLLSPRLLDAVHRVHRVRGAGVRGRTARGARAGDRTPMRR